MEKHCRSTMPKHDAEALPKHDAEDQDAPMSPAEPRSASPLQLMLAEV